MKRLKRSTKTKRIPRSGRFLKAALEREVGATSLGNCTLRSLRLYAQAPEVTMGALAELWPQGKISRQAMTYIEDRRVMDTPLERVIMYAQGLKIPQEIFIEWFAKIISYEVERRLP